MKVLFVCTGNTCRSPMLKFAFEDYLDKIGVCDITVDCAGIMQHEKPMSQNTVAVLKAHGVPYSEVISKYCSEKVLESVDFVFTMTREHASELEELYGNKYNIIPLYDVIGYDIADPYGNGFDAYEAVYDTFKSALSKIYKYIRK